MMKRKKVLNYGIILGVAALLSVVAQRASAAPYLKIPDPPDVDKPDRDGDGSWPDAGDNSCWLASAANILSAAGYGGANSIYGTLVGNFGYAQGGFQGTAINWYLTNHPMTGNPYTVLTEYDRGALWDPYWNPGFIASELRECEFVGIAIYADISMTTGGAHALTVWGDDDNSPPTWIWVTDSDRDRGVLDIDSYDWTRHQNARGTGKDLYSLDYWGTADTGYLGYVATLSPVPEASTLLLFGSGLAGILGLRGKRLISRRKRV